MLERAGAFTVALDDEGTWYRYHPLLREVLRRRLEAETPKAEIAALYVRASMWLEGHDLLDEALSYALAVARYRAQWLSCKGADISRWTILIGAVLSAGFSSSRPSAIERHVELLLARAWINQWRYSLPDSQADLDCVEDNARRVNAGCAAPRRMARRNCRPAQPAAYRLGRCTRRHSDRAVGPGKPARGPVLHTYPCRRTPGVGLPDGWPVGECGCNYRRLLWARGCPARLSDSSDFNATGLYRSAGNQSYSHAR